MEYIVRWAENIVYEAKIDGSSKKEVEKIFRQERPVNAKEVDMFLEEKGKFVILSIKKEK